MKGVYLVYKPPGITSHDVINRLRKITGEKTIGHAGTLDPAASGLLIIAIGREYTVQISKYAGLNKEYLATMVLGKISDTYDREGYIKNVSSFRPALKEIQKILTQMVGKYNQTPPIYSAKKIKGKPAYKLARAGKNPQLKPVPVSIYQLELISYKYPELKIKTLVSSGTYIRSLAHDMGQKLGTGAYLKDLERTKIGDYSIQNAAQLNSIYSPDDLSDSKIG